MTMFLQDPYMYLDIWLLVFVRSLGLTLIAPFYGNRNVPYMVKISFALFLSMIIITVIPLDTTVSSEELISYALAVGSEFLNGLAIGFGGYMVFSILSLTGQFIDAQIGFSMVNVFDPLSQIQFTITGNVYYNTLILVALATNAHHMFIHGLIDSYFMIPLGKFTMTTMLESTIVDYFTTYFALSLRFAAPIFFVMIITNVVLGVLARAVPQLNMFVIGFPIKIMFGLITIFLLLGLFGNVSHLIFDESYRVTRNILEGLSTQ